MTRGVDVWCYYQWIHYKTKKEAMALYKEGMMCCEGCEKERYTNIFLQLLNGSKKASDGCYVNEKQQKEIEAMMAK